MGVLPFGAPYCLIQRGKTIARRLGNRCEGGYTPSAKAFHSASPGCTGAVISMDSPETGCVKAMRRAYDWMPSSAPPSPHRVLPPPLLAAAVSLRPILCFSVRRCVYRQPHPITPLCTSEHTGTDPTKTVPHAVRSHRLRRPRRSSPLESKKKTYRFCPYLWGLVESLFVRVKSCMI